MEYRYINRFFFFFLGGGTGSLYVLLFSGEVIVIRYQHIAGCQSLYSYILSGGSGRASHSARLPPYWLRRVSETAACFYMRRRTGAPGACFAHHITASPLFVAPRQLDGGLFLHA